MIAHHRRAAYDVEKYAESWHIETLRNRVMDATAIAALRACDADKAYSRRHDEAELPRLRVKRVRKPVKREPVVPIVDRGFFPSSPFCPAYDLDILADNA